MSVELAAEMGVPPVDPFGGSPAALNIVFIPRQFQFAGETFDDQFHFVGPCLGARESDTSWQPPDKRPLLFVSLGTTPVNNAESFRMCLDAVGDEHWQVTMAIGEQVDPAELGTIPNNTEIRSFFLQLAVLRHADVFVSHAGMNSTMESLYYGVPIVAVPRQAEQKANARQFDQLGLGRQLATELSPDLLRRTVDHVHADERIRSNVTEMSKILRNSGGAVAAADAIEAHLHEPGSLHRRRH